MTKTRKNPDWPVLTSYDRRHLSRIALPLGGIGTGTVSLGGRGDLRDWEIVNRAAKGFAPDNAFFALYARPAGGTPVTRVLEGPIEPEAYEGFWGVRARNHGLPRFRNCEFHAAYPFGQVLLSDPDVPVDVRLEAFNPLVPPDADASGIPAAILRFVLTNRTGKSVTASVCGSMNNFIGADGSNSEVQWTGLADYSKATKGNHNAFRRGRGVQGLFMHSDGIDPGS
ncbi:MAG TPA: GH116 family glycosyl-hydrolase, partial [Phycisphaerae bacterium]|nr:GH116 family glycosyl-hydrolase [Phycisphaerae bacterium]